MRPTLQAILLAIGASLGTAQACEGNPTDGVQTAAMGALAALASRKGQL